MPGDRGSSLTERDVQAGGFPGKVKAYESKQAISVRRPGPGVWIKGQDTDGEKERNWWEKQTLRNVCLL